jgi:uridine kinase
MHQELVEPSRRWADLVLPGSSDIAPAVDAAARRLEQLLEDARAAGH